jgi:hypothetical protein
MRTAMGAGHLSGVREIRGYGTIRTSGLNGDVTIAVDTSSARFAQRANLSGIGPYSTIYDGTMIWSQDISGGVHAFNAPFPRQEAITRAYIMRYGFLSGAANATCLGTGVEDGRRVLLVRVQPQGGTAAKLFVDARTHLLDGYAERFPIDVHVTKFSNYRNIGGVMLPFRITSGSAFEPANADVLMISRYSLSRAADSSDFAKPHMQNRAVMDRGVGSTTIPMRIEDGETLVWASINGHAAMPFLLDSGGHAIFTRGAATALKLKQVGSGQSGGSGSGTVPLRYAHVASLRIGSAVLPQQSFLVIDYPRSFWYRGRGKQPLAGILGLEIFEHFRVTLNYDDDTMTLTPVGGLQQRASANAIALSFDEDMPLAEAAIDGHIGLFGIDTGNSGALIAYGTFLQRTGLNAIYPNGKPIKAWGTGGSNTARMVRIRTLRFGGRVSRSVRAAFTNMKSGSFSSWTEAGDIGYEQISSFNATFDFENGKLYLAPRRPAAAMHRSMSLEYNY